MHACMQEIRLRRERVSLSPVFATALPPPPGAVASGPLGYIRLTSFSQNAASEMATAIQQLEVRPAGRHARTYAHGMCAAQPTQYVASLHWIRAA